MIKIHLNILREVARIVNDSMARTISIIEWLELTIEGLELYYSYNG